MSGGWQGGKFLDDLVVLHAIPEVFREKPQVDTRLSGAEIRQMATDDK
jgi:hypothetical protein